MGCVAAILAMFMPRVVIVLLVILSDWLGEAYDTTLWPLLGFFFMPYTMLAYALAWHMRPEGSVTGIGLVIVIIAVLMDLGAMGGGAHQTRGRTQ